MFKKKVVICFVLFFIISLSGCERKWNFAIIDLTDYNFPKFCISRHKNCSGDGISLAHLSIDEVNKKGNLIKPMWTIVAVENENIKTFVYGTAPKGFNERSKAVPLEIDKLYSVQSSIYFQLVKNNGSVEAIMYSQQEFNKKFRELPGHP